ncbi:MAG: PD-(D/E)XK nuclease family protein, partial [Phycisphaerales bacterium]|nr:PD-(D/E)XK nuclease family protein [Phycisphaerales bacterium]
DPAAGNDAVSRLGAEFKAANRMRDVFDQARRDERRLAAAAIDAMELGEIDRDELAARLNTCADRIAVVNAVLRDGQVPSWVEDNELAGFAQQLVDALAQKEEPKSSSLHPPMIGPLKLSFTQISSYLHCPRCYLVEQVLRLPSEETTNAVIGKAVHEALELFYQQWRIADAEGEQTPGLEKLESLTKEKFFRHWPNDVELDTSKLEQAIAMVGVLWSSMHADDVHIEELEKKMVLPFVCEGVTHQIRAVLDRVDATASGGRRVIDYKTGKARKELAEPKEDDLQLGIYAMALNEAFGDPGPGSVCEYWLLQDGTKGSIAMDAINMDKVHKKINKAIAGLLAGEWEQSTRCKGGQWTSACSILDG